MSKSISKEMLYEEFFNEVYEQCTWKGYGADISGATEYSEDSESFKYSSFISGLCSMTNKLLNKLSENEDENPK